MGQYRAATADSDTNANSSANTESDAFTFCLTDTDSIFQRNAIGDVAAINSSDVRVSHADAESVIGVAF